MSTNKQGHLTNDLASGGFGITPSDTDLLQPAYGLYIGGDGDLSVITVDGSEFTLYGLTAGQFVPLIVTRVKAATSCTNVIGLK